MSTLMATLGLDSQNFEKGLEGSTEKIRGLAQAFGLIITAGTVANFTKQAIDLAESIDRVALKTGTSTDAVQRLGFVVEQNKGSMRDLEQALVQLGIRAENNEKAFEKWGITVQDATGKTRPVEQLFLDVADRIQGATTQSERMAIAMDLMGRSGQELIPTLQLGGDEIDRIAKNAAVMREESVKAITETSDALGRFKLDTLVTIGNILGAIRGGDMAAALEEVFAVLDRIAETLGKGFVMALGVLTTGLAQAAAWFANMFIENITRALELIPGIGGSLRRAGDAAQSGIQDGVTAIAQGFTNWRDSLDGGFGFADGLRARQAAGMDPLRGETQPAPRGLTLAQMQRIEAEAIADWERDLNQQGRTTGRAAAVPPERIREALGQAANKAAAEVVLEFEKKVGSATITRADGTQETLKVTDLTQSGRGFAEMVMPDGSVRRVSVSQPAQAAAIAAQEAQAQAAAVSGVAQATAGTGNMATDIARLVDLAVERNILLNGRYKAQ